MSERSDLLLLQDILDALDRIQSYTKDISLEQYMGDIKTKHAVERNFSIIGEVVVRLDNGLRNNIPKLTGGRLKISET